MNPLLVNTDYSCVQGIWRPVHGIGGACLVMLMLTLGERELLEGVSVGHKCSASPPCVFKAFGRVFAADGGTGRHLSQSHNLASSSTLCIWCFAAMHVLASFSVDKVTGEGMMQDLYISWVGDV